MAVVPGFQIPIGENLDQLRHILIRSFRPNPLHQPDQSPKLARQSRAFGTPIHAPSAIEAHSHWSQILAHEQDGNSLIRIRALAEAGEITLQSGRFLVPS